MQIRALQADLFVSDCRARLPFKFGAVTMTQAPLLHARVRIETRAGQIAEGLSADLLVPKWFDKNPTTSVDEDRRALIQSATVAGEVLTALGFDTPFKLWWHTFEGRVGRGAEQHTAPGHDPLVRGFGVALVERALLDAACRAAEVSFFEALQRDLLGFEPGLVHKELAGFDPRRSLPREPLREIVVRHTVGMLDALRVRDIAPRSRVDDGLPQALEEDIARYGLSMFKIKIGKGREADLARLLEVAAVLECVARPAITLDGNEQYHDLDELVALLDDLRRDPRGRRMIEGLLYVEQPLPREQSFDARHTRALARLAESAPVVIDEADRTVDSFPQALRCGYRGVSVKNCKGVFRALLDFGLCEAHGQGAFQCAEDLTNLPVLALQQDLATLAALGLPHAERNGHHYFRGLDHLPAGEARAALRAHPDLYAPDLHGRAMLAIHGGKLSLASLQQTGYGYNVALSMDARVPVPKRASA